MSMTDSKPSNSDSSNSNKDEPQKIPNEPQQVLKLEAQELAKHRLRHLKDSFEEYTSSFDNYMQRHYLIVALSGVVILIGIIIVFLKVEGRESLLNSFKAIQSSFASLVSGGSIIAFGSSILFADKKDSSSDAKFEPKEEAIRLCIERDLGEKLDEMTRKLREKREYLELAKSWQSIWAILGSIVILFLVGIDFFGFLPDIKYIDIGLDCLLSLTGLYFLSCTCILNSVLSNSREKLEKNHFKLFLIVIPSAYLSGLMDSDEIGIFTIIVGFFNFISSREHWIKEVYLSSDERLEVMYLLRGLNPDLSHLRVKSFCKELIPEKPTEKTPLVANANKPEHVKFIKTVDQIETKSKQDILEEYFRLGQALAKHLKGQHSNDTQIEESVKEIVKKFPSTETEEICKHYLELKTVGRGLTLAEFFDKHPLKKSKNKLLVEEINAAHDALKVYSIFNNNDNDGIGKKEIKRVKTFSASSIGKFTRNEISDIIDRFKLASYSPNNASNA